MLSRFKDWRNRLIANPAFQRFAARHWPFRIIARRRAVALFDLCAGFVYSQVLFACVQLELMQKLGSGPRSLPDLQADTGLDAEAMRRLLRAAVALDLLEERDHNHYALAAQGAAMLANPGIAAMVLHHRYLYRDLSDPVAMLQRQQQPTHLQQFWRYAMDSDSPTGNSAGELLLESADSTDMETAFKSSDAGDYRLYSELMAASQHMIAEQVLAAYDFSRHRSVLDIGGGVGEFLHQLGHQHAHLQLGLMDLPPVVEQARARQQADARPAMRYFPGSFLHADMPADVDLITLVRVLHDHDDPVVSKLLSRCAQTLPLGGRLLIAEPLAATAGAKAMGDAYFGIYLYAMGQGRPRSFKQYQDFLHQAGFHQIRQLKTSIPMLCSLIVATVDKKV